MVKEIELL